ncbi:hypothetical protein [Streptomyces sp. NPDC048436]|uniref:hypothetical protein n=1 Tax=Streptomyces sp. NPDC048436 TaxID=3365550 RepID=UPI00371A6679
MHITARSSRAACRTPVEGRDGQQAAEQDRVVPAVRDDLLGLLRLGDQGTGCAPGYVRRHDAAAFGHHAGVVAAATGAVRFVAAIVLMAFLDAVLLCATLGMVIASATGLPAIGLRAVA